jgi:hypothetical protein
MKKILIPVLLIFVSLTFYSCSENAVNTISQVFNNKVKAKDRLDSAYAQVYRNHSPSSQLVMIFGKNVIFDGTNNGTTDISLYSGITDPNNIGAWLYFFKKPGTDSIYIYTPNPTPGASDCIELTALFNLSTITNLITDTTAKNIVTGALNLFTNSSFAISTNKNDIVNSDVAFGYSYSSNPIIKFNSSFTPSSSTNNGQSFFSTGSSQSVNMFLIPALGTLRLDLPQYIQSLVGLPSDLWIVNYKKNTSDNFIVGTVVKSDQTMGISIIPGLSSKAINLSKF